MLNYKKDGRAACIKFIADYIRENYPTQEEQESERLGITVKELRAQRLKEKLNKVVIKARINLKWRNHLQERLLLNDEEIIKATNTVLEILEKALLENKIIRIRNLGDFETKALEIEGFKKARLDFNPEIDWIKELNQKQANTSLRKDFVRTFVREPEIEEFV